MSTAVGAVPRERAGLAGGVNNTAHQAGGTVGVALYLVAAAACAVRLPDGGQPWRQPSMRCCCQKVLRSRPAAASAAALNSAVVETPYQCCCA